MGVASSSASASKPIGPLKADDDDLQMAQEAEEVHILVTRLNVSKKVADVLSALTGDDPMTHFALLLRKSNKFFVFDRSSSKIPLRAVAASDIKGYAKGSKMKPRGNNSIRSFISSEENKRYNFLLNNCKHLVYRFYRYHCERVSFAGGDSLHFFPFCVYVEHLCRLDGEKAEAAMK